jgi:hypothetical protein
MQVTDDQPRTTIEVAMLGLQEERQSCVKLLEAALVAHEANAEIEAYLRRIEYINSALIRLAGAHVVS